MANVPISAFTVPANTVGIGATGYSLTGSASASFMDLAGTWNTSGTPTAIKLNITDTASNAASLLMDLGTGGGSFVSRFKVQKNGDTTFNLTGGSISINNANGIDVGTFNLARVNSVQFGAGNDLILGRRTAANLRLGAADAAAPVAQTLSVQSVVAGTTNTAGTNLTITGSQGTGTGAGGSLIFQVAPAGSSGSAQNALATAWQISGAGHFLAGTDSTYDIGANGANRPRIVYAGNVITSVVRLQYINSLDNVISFFNFYDNTGLASFALGATNARMNWGGTTSSFPALKRSTTFLHARLADDSAFAGFASANMQAATAYTVATLPTPTTGMIARVTDATAPTIGTTVVGGGAAYALVNYNGANWTVIGV